MPLRGPLICATDLAVFSVLITNGKVDQAQVSPEKGKHSVTQTEGMSIVLTSTGSPAGSWTFC